MNIRIQSIERKKKVAEYIHAHNGRVSIMALAAELGCHYSTAAHYISELQAEGMEVQLEGRIRNPRESVLAYVKSHPEKISFMAAANELHCSYETVRKYIRVFQSEGMDIQVLNLNEAKKNEKAR